MVEKSQEALVCSQQSDWPDINHNGKKADKKYKGKQFEETFEKAWWRKVKKRLYVAS